MYLDVSEFFLDMYFLFFFSIKNTCKKNGNKLKKKYTYTISSFFVWVGGTDNIHVGGHVGGVCEGGHGGTYDTNGTSGGKRM